MSQKQKKGRLDIPSLKKIGWGVLVYGLGSAGLYVLSSTTPILKALDMDNPAIISIIATLTPTLTKLIKEWIKGETDEEL